MNVEFRLMLNSVVCGQLISFDVQYVLVRGIPFYVFESNEMYYGCFFSLLVSEKATHTERERERNIVSPFTNAYYSLVHTI